MGYDILNKLKYQGRLGECKVTITHRGAPDDVMEISGYDITEVKKSNFYYKNESGDDVFIPYHMILEIIVSGKTMWKKRAR